LRAGHSGKTKGSVMGSGLQAALDRIHDIEARLGIVHQQASAPPAQATTTAAAGVAPFPVMLAQANGQVQLQAIGPHVGPFTPQIESLIARHSVANGLDPAVVRAVVQQESGGNPRDVSAAGAQGLMQLMPDTGKMYGVTDAFDPEQNIAAGTRHLSNLMREFNNDLPTALAAYNAGSGAVRKAGGIPNYPETKDYVRRITEMVNQAKGR
jgi:soluble lytic murein transglycosylase-like protein